MEDETSPTAPGASTSEFKLTLVAMVVGFVLEAAAGVLHALQDAGNTAPWIPAVLLVVGALLQIATALGYQKSRTLVKTTALAADAAPPKA